MNSLCFTQADPLEGVQIDHHVSQGVVIGDGCAVAQFGSLDAKIHSLAVDPLSGGALLVDGFVFFALAVQLITQACAGTGGQGGDTTAFLPIRILGRTDLPRVRWMEKWANESAALVGNERGLTPEDIT